MDEDTEPYVCLSEECTSPILFFARMRDWIGHMKAFHSDQWNRKIHMSTWYCDIGHETALQFNDRESFLKHMKDPESHDGRDPPTDLQLDTLSRSKQKVHVREDEYCCPICDCVPESLAPVIKMGEPAKIRDHLYEHIAAHIKDLAFKSVLTLDIEVPDQNGQSEIDDSERGRLRGDSSAASYPSGLDKLRLETSLTFDYIPIQEVIPIRSESYNELYYEMDAGDTLWDNADFLEYWELQTGRDQNKPDAVLDHFAQIQRGASRDSDRHPALSDDVEDEVKGGVWGYLVPLDPKYGDKPLGLKRRNACPQPEIVQAVVDGETTPLNNNRPAPIRAEEAYERLKVKGVASGGYLIGRHPECGTY